MDIFAQLVVNSLIAGAIYTLITLGFNLIFGATRFINMAHGSYAAVGAYGAFVVLQWAGWGILPSVILGALAGGAAGALSDIFVFKPLRKRRAKPLVHFVASLGLFTVAQAILSVIFSSQFFLLSDSQGGRVFEIAGAYVTGVQLWIIGLAVAVSVTLFFLMRSTMFGKVIRALSDDEEVAKMLGINTDRVISWIFFLGAALAGFAGVLVGMDTGVQPNMGLFIVIEGAIPSIVGGVGNMAGGVLGAFLLGFVENFAIWFIPSQWKGAIAFGLLTLFLIFRPQGIMGRK